MLLAVVVVLALVLTFAPYIFGGKTLLSSAAEVPSLYVSGARYDSAPPQLRSLDPAAAGFQTEPWLAIQHRIVVGEHRMPFWDPYEGYGQPFAAAMQPQPFYPLTALLALDPTPLTYTWFVLARLFIAGWFAALFVLLFADRYAAATTGVATALGGYYLLYYDIPHLSVDTALPMLLWATELVVRRASAPRCAALAIAAGLTYVGGMPETALLSISVATAYALLRIRGLGEGKARRLGAVAAGHAIGLLSGAIMLLPFAEFVRHSFNAHEASKVGGTIAGLASDGSWERGVLTELAPLAFGYPWASILTGGAGHSGVRGFVGCAVLLLAAVAAASALVRRGPRTQVVVFFCSVALFCVLKRYGNPLVQWTGTLPLFSLVHFPKYLEYCLGDALTILAGFGVAALREREVPKTLLISAFAAVLGGLSFLYLETRPLVPPGPYAWQYGAALAIAVSALLVTGVLCCLILRGDGLLGRAASAALPVVILCEVFIGYAAPQLWRIAPSANQNPYVPAPYVAFLDRHVDRARERIFGIAGILFPDWPGAYGFADPRSLNALYPQDYLPFIDRFVTTHPPASDDQFDRFTATRPLDLSAPLVRRWLALSSVGWLLSPDPVNVVEPPPGAFLSELWSQVGPTIPTSLQPAVHVTSLAIDRVAEDVLFEHPPNEVRFVTVIPPTRPLVEADIALDPVTYSHPPVCGGPVAFTIDAEIGGRIVSSATRAIDPKHRLPDRHWLPIRLDLARWANQPVSLRFATAAHNTCAAYAIWGEPRFSVNGARVPVHGDRLFQLAFESRGAFVYRVPGSLPRLMLYHRARTVATSADALAALALPAFDPKREVVMVRPAAVLGKPRGTERAIVTSQGSEEIVADVDATADALLVQNDTFFPGWKATVDGRSVPVVRANFLFRGIAVPRGHHTIRIFYEAPGARVGTLASGFGCLLICGLLALPAARRTRAV